MSDKQIEDNLRDLNNQIIQLYQAGRYIEAIDLATNACDLERQHSGEDHPNYAISLNNLAEIHHKVGNYVAAESLIKRAIEILYKVHGENHPNYATGLNNLGMLYLSKGNYSEAKPLLCQALEIRQKTLGKMNAQYAESLNNLAKLYISFFDYVTAKRLLRKANWILRTILGEDNLYFIINLNNQASLYQYMSDYISSENMYKKSLDILTRIQGETSSEFDTILNNLALLYTVMGNCTEAEVLFIKSINIRRTIFGEKHPVFASSLNNLGELYYSMGKIDKAESLFCQAINIRQNFAEEKSQNLTKSLLNLALLYVATNREKEALYLMQRLLSIEYHLIGQVFSIGSEAQRTTYIKHIYFILDIFLTLVVQYSHACSQETINSALNLVFRWKSIGVEAFGVQRDSILGGKYPELMGSLSQLTLLRRQIAAKTLDGPGCEGQKAHKSLLNQWNSLRDKLESELASRIPEMNLEQKLRKVDQKAVAEALPVGALLIEFVRLNTINFKAIPFQENPWKTPRYIAFTLAKNSGNVKMIDLGDAEQIDQLTINFLADITGEHEIIDIVQTNISINSTNIKLCKKLFDPLLSEIGDYKKLILAPDGKLLHLPFEILRRESGKLLIDDFIISYINVGRDVLRFTNESIIEPTNSVVIADPDFDLRCDTDLKHAETNDLTDQRSRRMDIGDLHFDRLDETREEGKQIAGMLGVQPWLGSDALESKVKAMQSPFILHIATHGILLRDQMLDPKTESKCIDTEGQLVSGMLSRMTGPGMSNPLLRSGLALAGINTWLSGGNLPHDAEDGILTAEDVSGLDLLATKLVVLSACETGLGKIQRGEGIFGLRRAFLLAGAKTLIISLWAVDDERARELMIDFYQRILAGQHCSDALRAAKLSMKSKNPHPYYWGAFICQGDP